MEPKISIQINEDIIWNTIHNRCILINKNTGNHYVLNSTGKAIWKTIVEKKNLIECVEDLQKEYCGQAEGLPGDLETFLDNLAKENVIFLEKK